MTTIEHRLPPGYRAGSLRADVRAGLTATPKSLPPKWCYDARGSALFEKITELPEYYPTRAERSILRAVSPQSVRIPDLGLTVQFAAGEEMRTDEDDRYGVSLSVPVQPTRVPILLLATDQLLKVS